MDDVIDVVIVGGGIAGLSAGIYARRSGLSALILEAHNIPGGNSTSWRRGGYLFEGGMHWLTGSSEKTALYRLWTETGALASSTPVLYRDPFFSVRHEGKLVSLFRSAEKLRDHFLEVSPEDRAAIISLYGDMKKFRNFGMPVMDIGGLKVKYKTKPPLSALPAMIRTLPRMNALNKITSGEYAARFKHPALRLLLENVSGVDNSAVSLIFTLSCFAGGDGGYPEGGSLAMAKRMADQFEKFGGVIRYRCKADRIRIETGRPNHVTGVTANGALIQARNVIAASDTITARDTLFDVPPAEQWLDEIHDETVPMLCEFLSLGVEADLSTLPESLLFTLTRPFTFAGVEHKHLSVNNYASFGGYAPEGCTALTSVIMSESYDYWKARKADGTYQQKKEEYAALLIDRIGEELPETKGNIAVWDLATPLTYERYCGTWRGSWMSLMEKNKPMKMYSGKSKTVKGLYFAGQRIMPPGGLPGAVNTGRQAVQYLCRDEKRMFEADV